MEATATLPAHAADPMKAFADKRTNDLWDVVALLHAVEDRIEAAQSVIAGYTISNDKSEREWQIELSGRQWSKGKCCETFNPLGPVLVTADELDAKALQLRSWVNGQARQDSSTADMIFDVATLIMALSHVMVLDPGDLINTGTPEGVALSGRFPYLSPGDVMACEIEGIGRIEQKLGSAS